MARAKRERVYRQSAVNVAVLFLVILLAVYLAVQLFGNGGARVTTLRTQTVTETEYAYLKGYVFRDESVICVPESGVVERLAYNGERIGTGHEFARFYPHASPADAQSRLDSLTSRISLLEGRGSGSDTVADLAAINDEILRAYYSYTGAVGSGELSEAAAQGDGLLGALVDYGVATGRDDKQNVKSTLERERFELLSAFGQPESFVTEEGCHFLYSFDGYEDAFEPAMLDTLTVAQLEALAAAEPTEYSGTVIGRVIHSPKWYVSVICEEAEAMSFAEGETYVATLSDGYSVQLLLERKSVEEGGTLLVFSCNDLSKAPDIARAQSVRVALKSTTGYRVPTAALAELEDGELGVYVLVGDRVEFRRVTKEGEGRGYILVRTYLDDAGDGFDHEYPYLSENELIITSGNDLYDGKRLN